MFEGQPKGLYALALANTGERFGYYTMLAIFTLFLQAKFGFTATVTSNIFAGFLALVYFLPVVGGILADKFGFGKMVTSGIVVMFVGYLCLAFPAGNNAVGIAAMIGSLFLIALGTGLFKGNLQVMVGNLYDDPKYSAKRDTAFSIFYMAINIGALFAPTAAEKITDWYMKSHNYVYNGDIPALAHQYLDGTLNGEALSKFVSLASSQNIANDASSLTHFASDYINVLSESYHMGFAVACVSLIVSMLIYVFGRKTFKHADVNVKSSADKGDAQVALGDFFRAKKFISYRFPTAADGGIVGDIVSFQVTHIERPFRSDRQVPVWPVRFPEQAFSESFSQTRAPQPQVSPTLYPKRLKGDMQSPYIKCGIPICQSLPSS